MGRIGPSRNRREVAGPGAGLIRPMPDRTQHLQPATKRPLFNSSIRLAATIGRVITPYHEKGGVMMFNFKGVTGN